MKFLFAGLGSIGQRHVRNLYSLGYREFFAYRTTENVVPVEAECGVKRVSSYEAGLAISPDVVFVTNPTSFHVPYALAAIKSGAHVFVEKPLSHSRVGLKELVQASADTGRIVYVGYHLRFHPILRILRMLVKEGAVGKPIAATMRVGQYLPDWHPDEDYTKGYAARQDLGGGVVGTLSHEIDYAIWLLGWPRSVYSAGGHVSDLQIDVEDVSKMLVVFNSGCIADIHLDYLQRPPERRLQVIGNKGKIDWDYFNDTAFLYRYDEKQAREVTAPLGFEKNDMYIDEVRHFFHVINGEEKPEVSLDHAVKIVYFSLDALESMKSGKLVNFIRSDNIYD